MDLFGAGQGYKRPSGQPQSTQQQEYDLLGLGTPTRPSAPLAALQAGPMMLAGGAGTPCNSPFHPSTAQTQAAAVQPSAAATSDLRATQKAAEAERKRQVELAAAKRCASGRIFAGTSYRLDATIGKGSYGRVKLATDMRTGQKVAIKFLAKDLMVKQAHWVRVRREINLLTLAHHPHVIQVHEWLESAEDVLIVMEYVQGKDLFDRINEKPEKRYSEQEARPIFRQMISALDYCHQNRMVHRDLKPENVMIDAMGRVKLIDFGFANLYHPRDQLTTNCGSPLYAAPEIVQAKPYVGPEVDIWSLGIVLYAMLVGALPFEDENLKGLYRKIGEGRFTFPEHVSTEARDLIRSMLRVNVLERAKMPDISRHRWVNEGFSQPPESHVPLRPASVDRPREDLVRLLPEYGYNLSAEGAKSTVRLSPDSPAFAGYCLLEEKERREAYHQQFHPVYAPVSGYPRTPTKQQQQQQMREYRLAPQDEEDSVPRYANESIALSSIPCTPVKQAKHSAGQAQLQQQGSGLMAQAAASVVNKFRRFRDMKFGLAPSGSSPKGSRRASNV